MTLSALQKLLFIHWHGSRIVARSRCVFVLFDIINPAANDQIIDEFDVAGFFLHTAGNGILPAKIQPAAPLLSRNVDILAHEEFSIGIAQIQMYLANQMRLDAMGDA